MVVLKVLVSRESVPFTSPVVAGLKLIFRILDFPAPIVNGRVTPGAQNWLVLLVILEIVIEPEVVLTRVVDNVFVWPTSTNPNCNVSGLQASLVDVEARAVCA